jgi:NTE family protein
MKRALVVNAGGSKGSFGAGIVNALKDLGITHEIYVGCSTGSLIVPMAAANNIEGLKEGYTNLNFKDIFTISPFKVKKRQKSDDPTKIEYKLDLWNVFKNIVLKGKHSLGDHTALRKTIEKFFTEEDFNSIKNSQKQLEIVVTNITKQCTEYKNIKECTYSDFCDWMWASSAAPPVMSIVEKNGYQYVDGGVLEMLPIQRAIEMGAQEIDVIVLNEKKETIKEEKTKSILHFFNILIAMLTDNTQYDDENLGRLLAEHKNVKLNFYYTPRKLTENALIFEKKQMQAWYKEGYDLVMQHNFMTIDSKSIKKSI